MEQLRTILIVLGIVLVIGIWLADHLRRRRAAMRPPSDWDEIDGYNDEAVSEEDMRPAAQPDPDEWVGTAFTASRRDVVDDTQLEALKGIGREDEETFDHIPVLTAVVEQEALAHKPRPGAALEEEVIVLTLLAAKGRKLRGPLLLKALQEAGLAHGEMDIFHYHAEGHREPLFSVANILEPGRFVLSEIAQTETPGLALFMRLPTVMPGADALRLMLQKSHQIAAQLSATLCDGQRRPLEERTLAELEQKASAFPAL